MVATRVLEARGEIRVSSSLTRGTTIMALFSCLTGLLQGFSFHGAIVYRLGHLVFIQASGVRFPVALPSLCESGGMVYTADLKSAAERLTGSSPVSRTKFWRCRKIGNPSGL